MEKTSYGMNSNKVITNTRNRDATVLEWIKNMFCSFPNDPSWKKIRSCLEPILLASVYDVEIFKLYTKNDNGIYFDSKLHVGFQLSIPNTIGYDDVHRILDTNGHKYYKINEGIFTGYILYLCIDSIKFLDISLPTIYCKISDSKFEVCNDCLNKKNKCVCGKINEDKCHIV